MSFSRAFQWYHSHLDPIWPDGTFNASFLIFYLFNLHELDNFSVQHSWVRSQHTLNNVQKKKKSPKSPFQKFPGVNAKWREACTMIRQFTRRYLFGYRCNQLPLIEKSPQWLSGPSSPLSVTAGPPVGYRTRFKWCSDAQYFYPTIGIDWHKCTKRLKPENRKDPYK